jgi:hypothetical protein
MFFLLFTQIFKDQVTEVQTIFLTLRNKKTKFYFGLDLGASYQANTMVK